MRGVPPGMNGEAIAYFDVSYDHFFGMTGSGGAIMGGMP
jgi:hypothetical protein